MKSASDSTTQLQQCIQNVLTVLNDRAIVLTLSADFATALRDAAAMQEISPLSPLGYLRAAATYSEQGRQQAVVDICNEGLSIVNVSDPGYSKLQETKTVAIERDTSRIDYISQLPLDIVTHVLLPMILHDDHDDNDDGMSDPLKLCPYLDVSKIWCDRLLLACGSAFCFNIYSEETSAQVTRYAQHTKAIRIRYYTGGDWQSYFLRDANLCCLREMEIKDLNQTIDVDQLVSSLKSIGNTLTHLTISRSKSIPDVPGEDESFTLFSPPEPPLHVAGIVINCPNLVTLDVGYRFDTDFKYVPPTMTWPKLTTLSLDHYDGITFNGQFLEILKRFPSLEKLKLNPCTDLQPMTMIHRYFPSMKDLKLTTKLRRSSRARARYEQQQHEDQWMNEGSGLEKLSISEEYTSHDTWMDMCPMLKQHHNTLVLLQLDLGYAGNNDDDLFNLEYPCLKTLAFRCSDSNNYCFGWWIVRKAPFLEELTITADIIKSNPAILDFTPPSTLRTLAIDLFHVTRLDNTTVIKRFLGRFSEQKEGSSLKVLKLWFDDQGDVTPDNFVESICQLNQLQRLVISFISRRTQWETDHFIQMLVERCPQLLTLGLDTDNSPSPSAIKNLQKLQHLRDLGIKMDDTAEYNDSWDALGTLSQLDCIRIFSDYTVDRSYIKNLKNRRPGVKVIAPLHGFRAFY